MALEIFETRVLVVEDNPQALQLMKMLLLELGVGQVYTARDGREAQDFLDSAHELVNLIICDWRMPRMTGIALLQQVRMTYPNMPFMMVTANNDVDSVRAARDHGVNAYIAKPYSKDQLKRKLEALIQQM